MDRFLQSAAAGTFFSGSEGDRGAALQQRD